ncbi:hypothetical protein HHK36_008887 [Tetracentron sinense]|uniref:Uncharacterized protein n=1 Tax=Tetracentron sinense TaxID=13715 RepID=A0A835DHX0_TETSI|nr:hypothetical protein HHK36_008887 [Tetracentron sinense]
MVRLRKRLSVATVRNRRRHKEGAEDRMSVDKCLKPEAPRGNEYSVPVSIVEARLSKALSILKLRMEDGRWISDEVEIKNQVVEHFQNLYTSSNPTGIVEALSNVHMKTGALLLDGNTLNYFGKNIPINLVVAVVTEIVLVGGAEYYRIINGLGRRSLKYSWTTQLSDLPSTSKAVPRGALPEILGTKLTSSVGNTSTPKKITSSTL